jgi:anthranilate phosphoribosyltransferase
MPRRNSRPEAAVTTAGTASPSAQGQVMISTAAAILMARRRSRVARYQPRKLLKAKRCTNGE